MAYGTRPYRNRAAPLRRDSNGIPVFDRTAGLRLRYPMPTSQRVGVPRMADMRSDLARRRYGNMSRPNPYSAASNPFRRGR